jgi:hypothetical protein
LAGKDNTTVDDFSLYSYFDSMDKVLDWPGQGMRIEADDSLDDTFGQVSLYRCTEADETLSAPYFTDSRAVDDAGVDVLCSRSGTATDFSRSWSSTVRKRP